MPTLNQQYAANSYWQKAFNRISALDDQMGRCITDYCQNHRPEPELVGWIIDRLRGNDDIDFTTKPEIQIIVESLQQNHTYYSEQALPEIGQSFSHLSKSKPDSLYIGLCEKLFNLYATSLIEHINEEEILFERILSSNHAGITAGVLSHAEHTDESHALDEIIDVLKSTADPKAFDPGNILMVQLKNLSNDLKIHTFIEEQLLHPIIDRRNH